MNEMIGLIDGKQQTFSFLYDTEVLRGGLCRESALVSMTGKQFLDLCKAEKMEFQYGRIEFDLGPSDIEHLKALAANFPKKGYDGNAVEVDPASAKAFEDKQKVASFAADNAKMEAQLKAEADAHDEVERKAKAAVDAVKKLISTKPEFAKKKLQDIAEKYTGTEAAKEAAEMAKGIK